LSSNKSSAENCNSLTETGEDIAKETKRVKDGDTKVAFDHIFLGILVYQCLVLLGINGTGKTTTMVMLTTESPPTDEDAKLAGYSVTNQTEKN